MPISYLQPNKILYGDALAVLKTLPDECVECVITSPPYYALRDYGMDGQIGLEKTVEEYIWRLVEVFDEVNRVLKKTGTLWVNIGDTYYGGGRNRANHNPKVKSKSVRGLVNLGDSVPGPRGQAKALAQIPSRFAITMASRGWILRNEIVWHKPNCMPASVRDRFTVDFEKVYFFVKNTRYFFEQQFEPAAYDGRKDTAYKGGPKDMAGGAHERWRRNEAGEYVKNKRSVWSVSTKPFTDAHFATFPEALIEPMILAGCPQKVVDCNNCGVVLGYMYGTKAVYTMQRVWKNLSEVSVENRTPILQSAMQFFLDGPKPEDDKGLDDNEQGIQDGDAERTPESKQRRLRSRTQVGHGRNVRARTDAVRDSSSLKRNKNRQSAGKLGSNGQEDTRPTSQTTNKTDSLSSLWE